MNVRHPQGVIHSFSIKKIFYDKMDLTAFLFSCDNWCYTGKQLELFLSIFTSCFKSQPSTNQLLSNVRSRAPV